MITFRKGLSKIAIGTITGSGTIDVKSYSSDYESLTENNFCYEIISRTIHFGNISNYSGNVAVPSLSYEAQIGQLTVSNLSASQTVPGRDSYGINATAQIYLLE